MKRTTLFLILTIAGTHADAQTARPNAPPVYYNIRDFGAIADDNVLDSPAINDAIDVCARGGGGTVYVPAGTYLSGSIHLKSNIHLWLDVGATLLGAPQELNAYDPPEPFDGVAYQDGGHTYFHNSLMWGEDLTNVVISGPGRINGGGLTRKDKDVGKGSIGLGDKTIALKRCRQVVIRDITIFHGGHFAILATGCTNMTIDNVIIDTDRDGINLDCCRSVTVSNCRINAPNDDALCPKSSFALGTAVITEDITIVNCQLSGFEEGPPGRHYETEQEQERPYQVRHGVERRFQKHHHCQLHIPQLPGTCA
jgi:polygalacturonase